MQPDQSKLAELPGRGQDVTAKGTDTYKRFLRFFLKTIFNHISLFLGRPNCS